MSKAQKKLNITKTTKKKKDNSMYEKVSQEAKPKKSGTMLVHAELKGFGRPVCSRLGILWLSCAVLLMPAAADANALSVAFGSLGESMSVSSSVPGRYRLLFGAPIGPAIGISSALWAAPWAAVDGVTSSAGRCAAAADDFKCSAGRCAGNISVTWLHFQWNM